MNCARSHRYGKHFNSVLSCPLRFPRKNHVRFVFTPICFLWASCFIYVIYLYWYPRRFSYQVTLLNTTCVTSEEGTACPSGESDFTSEFWWGSCCSIFSLLCSTVTVIICPFSLGHCIVGPSSLYGFWLPLWYLFLLFQYSYKYCNSDSRNHWAVMKAGGLAL